MSAFGDYIRERREARGWEPENLATIAFNNGHSRSHVERLESGEAEPTFWDVVGLANAFELPLATLLRLSGCALPPGLALVEEGPLGASSREQALRDAVEDLLEFYDDNGCEYDHNDFCQVHYCGRPCVVEEARKVVNT